MVVAQVLRGFAGVLRRFETCRATGAGLGLLSGWLRLFRGYGRLLNCCQRLFSPAIAGGSARQLPLCRALAGL